MPEAKAKAKVRHERAISDFNHWLKSNPKASRDRQMKMFDLLVDGSTLADAVKKKRKNASHV